MSDSTGGEAVEKRQYRDGRPPLAQSLYDLGPPPPCPASYNLSADCLAAAEGAPDKRALSVYHAADAEPSETWTFAELADRVSRVAAGLTDRGLGRGDRVLLRLGSTSRFPLMFFGIAAAGGVAVPTAAQLTAAEARGVAEDAGARLLCVEDALSIGDAPPGAEILGDRALADLLATPAHLSPRPMSPDDPAYLVYTSGATGRPKGVLHAHRAVWARRMMWRDWYGLTPEDRMLHAGAFNWTYTLGAGLMDPWACGAATSIYAGPADPGVWPTLIARSEATLFAAVPSLYRRILKYGGDLRGRLGRLRHGLTAGERLPEAIRDDWRAATGLELYEALGMSECSTFVSSSPAAPPKPGRAGRPQEGRRVAILPVEADRSDAESPIPIGQAGVLAVSRRDPGLMRGYWARPDEDAATRRGDWFLTGDLAEMDADGYIAHLGRADDLMNAMGYRVAPQEVEEALLAIPGVLDCGVTEIEPKPGVRVIAAFLVPDPEQAKPELAGIHAALAERLAPYKRPREIFWLDALPRTPTGKLRRKALRPKSNADPAPS